ncbi:PRC-barrel domain-containing protein [Kitasatospora sp. NPDC049285]|uniref:PRC-barrel domain-containing protein n=1 Tax=Kitasatospora sp. NPDC049285 TaxID=3157096 RepID=UPI003413F675
MSEQSGIWQFRDASGHTAGTDLIGFRVEAVDGHIGKVDKLSEAIDAQFLVVDTGPWIFGRLVLLPAGTVSRIEIGERKVYVDLAREEIKASPDYDPVPRSAEAEEDDLRDAYTRYYGPFLGGPMH